MGCSPGALSWGAMLREFPDDLGNVMMAWLETSSYSVKVGDRAGAISVQRASTGEDIREQLRNRRIQIQAAKA